MMQPLSAGSFTASQGLRRDSSRYVGWGFSQQETTAVGSLGFAMEKAGEAPADAQKKQTILAERKALAKSLGLPLSAVKAATFQVVTSTDAKTSVAAKTTFS
mmetsp:Transcript_125682/g.391381  ORF Transcript_125682/g.391381 Transcript_125682/m.391381 type:complete len:102 (-) Transcript_125682:4-309(-)